MLKFKKYLTNRLFIAQNQHQDYGFLAFIIPPYATRPKQETVRLEKALTNKDYLGTFIFAAKEPNIATEKDVNAFLDTFFKENGGLIPKYARRIIWLTNPTSITTQTVRQVSITEKGAFLYDSSTIYLAPHNWFTLKLTGYMSITLDGSTLLLQKYQDSNFKFSGRSNPQMKPVSQGRLSFSGRQRGCLQFTGYIEQTWLLNTFRCGFQFFIPNPHDKYNPSLSWLPLIEPTSGSTDYIGFNISIDPNDPYNEVSDPCNKSKCTVAEAYASRRTYFDFTGKDVTLTTFYRTTFDKKVMLIPRTGISSTEGYNARLVINLDRTGSLKNAHFAPEGDFILALPNEESNNQSDNHLRCGLSGLEFFKINSQTNGQKGSILRFLSRKPAVAPNFFSLDQVASPVGPPIDPTASPFDTTYLTSWATLASQSGEKVSYVSQPKGAAFYGFNALVKSTDLFGHTTPGFQLTAKDPNVFPMLPYAGWTQNGAGVNNVMTAEQVQTLEHRILRPQRRLIVNTLQNTSNTIHETGTAYHTTPSGLIAKTSHNASGAVKWERVRLGANGDYTMAFVSPPAPLINALQTNGVFLVVANNKHMGDFLKKENNTMGIGGWQMQANIGTKQTYGDYRNVMIFKGRKGKLYDPENPANSLVATPQQWTQAQAFAVPTTKSGQGNEDAQLVILSQWLQTYFEHAHKQQGNGYFDKFNQIATQESWTGILFLRVDISDQPANFKGMLAGVTTPEAFNAHHLGIEISPVQKGEHGPQAKGASSIFGLIYYVDPDFSDATSESGSDPDSKVTSIPPTNSGVYNFRQLSLKILFENSAVKRFESYAQLTLNQLFGSTVTKTHDPNNIYRNVLLVGTMQMNNGKAVYSLSSKQKDAFYLDSNVVNKVQITDVLLSTRSGKEASDVVSSFGMTGFIDFFELKNSTTKPQGSKKGKAFDIFSFGNESGQDKLQKGLSFSNLAIEMKFSAKNPSKSTLTFDTSKIRFDLSHSTPRPNSLYLNLALDLDSLLSGTKDKGPRESGYLDVIPDLHLGGVSSGDWYGLRFKLNMGTPGELAGKVNLDSYFLLSWTADSHAKSDYKAGIGISLPGTSGGAKLISLQDVLKLSIGQIRLHYVKEQHAFLLLFTDIALKFLGLSKIPPNGNTLFYLFGNPKSGGKASGLGWYAMYARLK